MKSIYLLAVVISITVTGFFSTQTMAASIVYPGSVCHNYVGKDANQFEYYFKYGIGNPSPIEAKKVICPISKRINDGSGLSVRLNVEAPVGTMTCTLYSVNFNGRQLGSQTAKNSVNGVGPLSLQTPFTSTRSHSSVVCILPPGGTGSIYSIEVLN